MSSGHGDLLAARGLAPPVARRGISGTLLTHSNRPHLHPLPSSNDITSSQISCVTSPNLVTHSMRISKLSLMLDNATHYLPYPFTYQPDPIITQIEPNESFLAGGRLILVTGHHLASPQSTKLMLYHENKHNIINGTNCITQNDTLITCLTPAISRDLATNLLMLSANEQLSAPASAHQEDDNNNVTALQWRPNDQQANMLAYEQGAGLKLKMMFIMDDVKSVRNLDEYYHHLPHHMAYFEDPQLFRMPLQVIDYVEELIIAGENLRMKQLDQDMLITIGVHICMIKSVLPNQVTCEPPAKIAPVYDDSGRLVEKPLLPIVGLIGSNLRFPIGHMQYSIGQYQQMGAQSGEGSPLSTGYTNALATMHTSQQQSGPPSSIGALDYSSASSSSSMFAWILLSAVGFVIAFAITFFFAIARFRQSKAEREYKRIQLQMGSLDMNGQVNGSNSNGMLYSKMHLANGGATFFQVNQQQQQQNLGSRALDYVGGALSGVTSTGGKTKPFYQFTSQHQQPPLPSFPPSPLTDISSLIGSGASPAHVNQQQIHQQQHVIKLNSDGTITNATTANNNNNNQHHYSFYGVSNITAASSSSSSSSPGHNMFNNNNNHNHHHGNNNNLHQTSNGNSRNHNWTQEAPSTIVPYAVIEACNLTLEGKNAIKEFV